jgi:SRSO17 transposase
LRKTRWEILLQRFKGEAITVIVDETGDRKKGKTIDYVTRQYLGSVGKVDNGLVSVNIYAVKQNITFPLSTRVYKPEKTLKPGDIVILNKTARVRQGIVI